MFGQCRHISGFKRWKYDMCCICVKNVKGLRCYRFALFVCTYIWVSLSWYFYSELDLYFPFLLTDCWVNVFSISLLLELYMICKYPFLIAFIQVDYTWLKTASWRYLIRFGTFVVWPTIFACLVGSTWRFCITVRWLWGLVLS